MINSFVQLRVSSTMQVIAQSRLALFPFAPSQGPRVVVYDKIKGAAPTGMPVQAKKACESKV
jgi:hypothetical protein